MMLPLLASLALAQSRPITNAPIAPDAIYVGRAGAAASLSVVDLNGYGGGTGPTFYDVACPIGPGQTNFPNDPNVALQGTLLVPPLGPAVRPLAGGSRGALTLVLDSALDDRLLRSTLASIDDLALGASLDLAIAADACPGANPCAAQALKLFAPVQGGGSTLRPALPGETPIVQFVGGPNPISWAPHPNPPPLASSPACPGALPANEPTSVDTPLFNLLVPGPNPLGDPSICLPPTSLFVLEQNVFFQGPSPAAAAPACSPYAFRQQIGHFLYAVDRAQGDLLVLNSNRMELLGRIALPDPTRLAIGPNLDLLAVTNESADAVSFVDVDPTSATFHQVVKTVAVGDRPFGVAWESGNEDVLVACRGDGSVHVISAATLAVRKVVTNLLTEPFDVVTTPRQKGFGLERDVYYAWILNQNGDLALFESGPDGVNGWGYDDVIGLAPVRFASPKAIQPDPRALAGAVWIAHEDPIDLATVAPTGAGGPALTRVTLSAQVLAPQRLVPGSAPWMHDLAFVLDVALDSSVLTGVPVDLAFDDQRNLGSLPNHATPFSAGTPLAMNGKSLVKEIAGVVENASDPRLLFLAVPDSTEGPGVVDVVDLDTLTRFDTNVHASGVQSIPAAGARVVAHYFRQ